MKSFIELFAGTLAALSCGPGIAALPADLVSAKYSVFASDQNGDGCTDYLIKSPDAIVPIDLNDVFVPIPVPSKSLPFMLQSSPGCSYALVQGLTRAQVTSSAWKKADYQVAVGDVNGDGGGSLLLSPTASSSTPTFNVAGNVTTKAFALLQTLKSGDFQTGTPGTTVSLELTNQDQRTDLVIRRGNQVLGVYAAESNGTFLPVSSANSIGASYAVWNTFMAQLKSNDVDGAVASMSKSFQAEARETLTASDADLVNFASMVTEFDIVEAHEGYAKAVLILTEGGKKHMHLVLLGLDSDGTWKIFEM